MRGWIPPLPLLGGLLAFGLSWVALFALAHAGTLGASSLAFGWIHLVVLGWITLTALSILLHVIPAFLDVTWRGQRMARGCTLLFAVGVAVLLAGFFGSGTTPIVVGASLVVIALLTYLATLVAPLRDALRGERTERAVARAFAFTFAMLTLTALLGVAFAYALGGMLPATTLLGMPAAHALLGIGGWLSLLIFGVSARTMGPIAGAKSRVLALHILAGGAVGLGVVLAAVGAGALVQALSIVGSALILVGILAYALDIALVLRVASVVHRPPQVLMGAAALWAVVAAAMLLCTALGRDWATAAIYLALIGWIGSAVLAHLHHIGVRVVLTTLRGEDDETRPNAVLATPLTWATVGLYHFAVVLGAAGLLLDAPRAVELAAICGFAAFVTILINLRGAIGRARRLPIQISL